MRLILDADLLLGNITYHMIGSDTVMCLDTHMNTIYICAHLKDYKPQDNETFCFTKQFNAIQNIINQNSDKCVILMMDANTQIHLKKNIIYIYSKNGEKNRKIFKFNDQVNISAIISEFPTSNKMRGIHTAQLNKSLIPVSATIDHILVFNSQNIRNSIGLKRKRCTFNLRHVQRMNIKVNPYVIQTYGYVVKPLDSDPDPDPDPDHSVKPSIFHRIDSMKTLTTSPYSIPDHAFVISILSNDMAFGTLNIKGGIISNNFRADFEFIPQKYYNFFMNPLVKSHIYNILNQSFNNYTIDEILAKDFLSTPRCKIFDSMLPNHLVPLISIDNDQLILKSNLTTFIVSKDISDNYIKPLISSDYPELYQWFDILIKDLNTPDNDYQIRKFLLNKGYMLLNYWHAIQTDQTILIDDKSLCKIYTEIYKSSSNKISIGYMIREAKIIHPNLHIVSLQEMPSEFVYCMQIIEDIKQNLMNIGYKVTIYMNHKAFGSTQGAIISFN